MSETVNPAPETKSTISEFWRARERNEDGFLFLFATRSSRILFGGIALGAAGVIGSIGNGGMSMEGEVTEAKSDVKILDFTNTVDIRTASIKFKTEAEAQATIEVDSPGPGDFARDPDMEYKFVGYGNGNVLVDWEKGIGEQRVDGDTLVVPVKGEHITVQLFYEGREESQSDDVERGFYDNLDTMGDIVGLIPGIDDSDLDSRLAKIDSQIQIGMQNATLESFRADCQEQLNPKILASVDEAVTTIAKMQDNDAKIEVVIEGDVNWKEKNRAWEEEGFGLGDIEFDESSCDTTALEEGAR